MNSRSNTGRSKHDLKTLTPPTTNHHHLAATTQSSRFLPKISGVQRTALPSHGPTSDPLAGGLTPVVLDRQEISSVDSWSVFQVYGKGSDLENACCERCFLVLLWLHAYCGSTTRKSYPAFRY
ncbi:hypothetical protein BKA82DRAFT_1002862 [Pisolithus tinctorius]|uniref:Uncharacterized protein n=1 Tax=Pisolithus tinctorius Marx 270 TaxID=870435 RepID=A0A0C3P375_PISTI|nr:hypothetical protein BKA82DRAFT_1002862 [Pisolithus tinctorius]KIO01749.1 hypothetical protein M404DRAFT_1002862 [Pisolithus tinctorius Marx 270]